MMIQIKIKKLLEESKMVKNLKKYTHVNIKDLTWRILLNNEGEHKGREYFDELYSGGRQKWPNINIICFEDGVKNVYKGVKPKIIQDVKNDVNVLNNEKAAGIDEIIGNYGS